MISCGSEESVPGDSPGESATNPATAAATVDDPNLELGEIAQEVPGFAGIVFDPGTDTYVINSTVPDIDVSAVRAVYKTLSRSC